MVVGAGAGPGVGAADGPGGQALSLDQPRLQQDRVEARAVVVAPQNIAKQAEKTVVFEEDNKAGIKADELGEQQRQLPGIEYTTSLFCWFNAFSYVSFLLVFSSFKSSLV